MVVTVVGLLVAVVEVGRLIVVVVAVLATAGCLVADALTVDSNFILCLSCNYINLKVMGSYLFC